MNCIILLLLLCCCGGCGNNSGVAGNSGNCGCNCNCGHHHHHHHHHGNCGNVRKECGCEEKWEESCECKERDICDAINMTPPSWQDLRGATRDCDCKN